MTEQEYVQRRNEQTSLYKAAIDALHAEESAVWDEAQGRLAPFKAAVEAVRLPIIDALVIVPRTVDGIPEFHAFYPGGRSYIDVHAWLRVDGAAFKTNIQWLLRFDGKPEELTQVEIPLGETGTIKHLLAQYESVKAQALDIIGNAGWTILENENNP